MVYVNKNLFYQGNSRGKMFFKNLFLKLKTFPEWNKKGLNSYTLILYKFKKQWWEAIFLLPLLIAFAHMYNYMMTILSNTLSTCQQNIKLKENKTSVQINVLYRKIGNLKSFTIVFKM